jgi:hypothetical protein
MRELNQRPQLLIPIFFMYNNKCNEKKRKYFKFISDSIIASYFISHS